MPLLDLDRLDATDAYVRHAPFPHLIASGLLPQDCAAALASDFPRFREPGFFPYVPEECGPTLNALIAELCSAPVADRLGAALGIDGLGRFPTLVTISAALNRRHGTIHTDSRSKIATALLYLNADWRAGSAGCLRFLSDPASIESLVAPEVPPLYGRLAMFRRTDNSFHGHLPYAGERRVIQVAWVASEADKRRKTRRGRLSRLVKRWFPALDRRFRARD